MADLMVAVEHTWVRGAIGRFAAIYPATQEIRGLSLDTTIHSHDYTWTAFVTSNPAGNPQITPIKSEIAEYLDAILRNGEPLVVACGWYMGEREIGDFLRFLRALKKMSVGPLLYFQDITFYGDWLYEGKQRSWERELQLEDAFHHGPRMDGGGVFRIC